MRWRSISTLTIALGLTFCGGDGSTSPSTNKPPTPAPVASVTISMPGSSLVAGTTMQATATMRDASNNPLTGRTVSWSSSNNAVAIVSSDGLIAGIAAGGPVTITATSEGKSGSATVSVAPPAVVTQTLTLSLSGTGAGSVTSTPAGIACSTPSTGTCSSSFAAGTVVSLAAAPASNSTLTGWGGACSGTGACSVTMDQARSVSAAFAAITVVSVSVAPQTLNLGVGGAAGTLTASVVNTTGPVPSPTVAWSSSDTDVATVTGTGATATVTPVAAGSTTITATSGGVSGTAVVTVAAAAPPVVTVVASDANASEVGPDLGTFTITRTGATAAALSLDIELSGTATNGTDYTTVASTVTIPAGQSSATVQITPIADALSEGAETVILTLRSRSGGRGGGGVTYSVGTPSTATVTIADGVSAPPGTLINGQNHTGRIAIAGQIDTWTFTANQGDFIALSIGEVGTNTTFVPWIRLLRPDGAQIGSGYGDLVGQITVTAPSTGTYTVRVASGDAGGIRTGDYQLTLAHAPGTLIVPAGDEGGPMTNGVNHAGHIHIGDLDQWTFTANQGEFISVSVGEPGSNTKFVPWIRLIRPDGAQIGSGYGDQVGQITVSAPSSGTYTVVVGSGDTGFDESGDYVLTLAKAPGAFSVSSGDEGGPMTNGANHAGRIQIGDLDMWTFTANQGEFISLSVGEAGTNTSFVPWIRLVRPDGAQIGSGYGDLVGQITVSAPSTGTYTVIVSSGDTGADAPGDYVLTLAKAPGTFVVPAGDEGGPLTNGANHTGRINVGDLDQWTFTANQGEFILVSVGETGTNTTFVPWIRLIRPDGAQIGSGYGDLVGQIAVSAPSTGTYTVVVSSGDTGADDPGNYTLTVAKAPGTVTVPAGDEGGPMTNGANHTGHIFVGDVDQWTFSATQGEFISLDIGEVGSNTAFVPWIRLIRPDGAQIGSGYGDLAAQITVAAPSTGVYTVVVSSGDTGADAPGDYQLTLAKAPGTFTVPTGDEGGPIANGTSQTGHIHVGDLDMWTFTATQGASIALSVSEVGANTPFTPWIRLIRPNGAQIGSSFGDLTAQISVIAPSTGTYTVVVASGDTGGDATGDYRISLNASGGSDNELENLLGVAGAGCPQGGRRAGAGCRMVSACSNDNFLTLLTQCRGIRTDPRPAARSDGQAILAP